MQGQKATSVVACDSWKRLAAAATTPAINAAQSGWISGLLLKPDSQRRTSAPMAALAAISSRLVASSVPKMTPSEAAPMAANNVKRGVEAGGSRPAGLKRGLRSLGRQFAVADLIDHRRDGQYPAHVDTERLGGDDLRDGRALEFDGELAPVRQHPNRHAESAPKPLGSGNRPFCGLPVGKQESGCQRGRL